MSVGGADADVAQAAEVAERDGAVAVDAVMADAVLDAGLVGRGSSFDPCGEGGSRPPTVQCAMWRAAPVGSSPKVAPEVLTARANGTPYNSVSSRSWSQDA